MKKEKENPILTADLREILKGIMRTEIQNLPDTLSQLEPRVRLEIIIKLMPFVLPKVETIEPTAGEPLQWDM